MESVHVNLKPGPEGEKYTVCYSTITNEKPPHQAEVRYYCDHLESRGVLRNLAVTALIQHAVEHGGLGILGEWPKWMDGEGRSFMPLGRQGCEL